MWHASRGEKSWPISARVFHSVDDDTNIFVTIHFSAYMRDFSICKVEQVYQLNYKVEITLSICVVQYAPNSKEVRSRATRTSTTAPNAAIKL